MSSNLYHADLGMPDYMKRPLFRGRLHYSEHALAEARKDRYGPIKLPEWFQGGGSSRCIEVAWDHERNKAIKQVWRQPLDENRDLVLVIGRGGRVITVWVNMLSDTHHTLDASKYVRA